MKFPRIAAKLYEEPWMMFPGRYQEMCQGFEAHVRQDRMAADDPVGPKILDYWTDEERLAHPQVQVIQGVALCQVHGVTGKGISRLEMQCGGFDTNLFREQLRNIEEDPSIRALVIDFNSPGGMAVGNLLVAESIRAVSESGKKVYGYASKMCCSAAYWMASACDEFHAEPDAIVGSISTITSGVDSSRAWEKQGLELKLFATGKFKATGMPGKRWSEEEEANVWNRVRVIDAEFKGYVQERRGLAAEDMEGQWWYAKHAPEKLVDSVKFHGLDQLLEAVLLSVAV